MPSFRRCFRGDPSSYFLTRLFRQTNKSYSCLFIGFASPGDAAVRPVQVYSDQRSGAQSGAGAAFNNSCLAISPPAFFSQFRNAHPDLLEDFLINFGILAHGILDLPIFNLEVVMKYQFPGETTHVDDDIYLFPNSGRDTLGLKAFHPISVSHEGLIGQVGDKASRRQACAERVDDIGSINARDCLRHRAAASISDANEQDAFAAVFAHQEASLKQLIPGGWVLAPRMRPACH